MAKRKKRIPSSLCNHTLSFVAATLAMVAQPISSIRLYKNNGGVLRSDDILSSVGSNTIGFSPLSSPISPSSSTYNTQNSDNLNSNNIFKQNQASFPQTVLKRAVHVPIWSNRRDQPSRRSQLALRNSASNSPSRRRNDDVPILSNSNKQNTQDHQQKISSSSIYSSSSTLQNRFNRVRPLQRVRQKY